MRRLNRYWHRLMLLQRRLHLFMKMICRQRKRKMTVQWIKILQDLMMTAEVIREVLRQTILMIFGKSRVPQVTGRRLARMTGLMIIRMGLTMTRPMITEKRPAQTRPMTMEKRLTLTMRQTMIRMTNIQMKRPMDTMRNMKMSRIRRMMAGI